MHESQRRLLRKTWLFVAIVVLANVSGNFALGWGMKRGAAALPWALLNPWVLAGIALLILWTLSRMALLSWADLSYVLPVTSIGYVLNALIGWAVFGEHISAERWTGTMLIVAGTALVGAAVPSPERPPGAKP